MSQETQTSTEIVAETSVAQLVKALPLMSEKLLREYAGYMTAVLKNLDQTDLLLVLGMVLTYAGRDGDAQAVRDELAEHRVRWCSDHRFEMAGEIKELIQRQKDAHRHPTPPRVP